VAALTNSVAALRVYLSVASGLGLTVALWTGRRLRPAWVLGLAGVLFGGLWVAQYYGPQAGTGASTASPAPRFSRSTPTSGNR